MTTKEAAPASKTKKKKGEKKARPAERIDRRFLPESTTSSTIVYVLAFVGALALGAGTYAQFGRDGESILHDKAFWFFASGAVAVALALWFSSSGEAALRVGAPGVAFERGSVRRIPWFNLESVAWAEGPEALSLTGKDEEGKTFSFQVRAKAHPQAAAWILKEAFERVPERVEVPDTVKARLPEADEYAGQKILEPLQLVGKKCAESGKGISYEHDARVCPKCERIYHKHRVPKMCACGADLKALRDQVEDDS
ncbi:MAG: hypothetical protein U0174_14915 [Polyangiaceae bacterium]